MRWKTAACLLALAADGPDARAQFVDSPRNAFAASATAGTGSHASHLVNADEVRKRLGLLPEYGNVPGIASVKVAVLDYGFEGVGNGRPYLPEDAVIVEHYDPDFVRRHNLGDPGYRKAFEPLNRHGRIMAQILWAVTGSDPRGPRFYLLNANGPTMLRRAVRYAIEQGVDIILFSGSFEGGGNGDGRGPIDHIVDEALGADILWINAAGNYGRRVYNGPVRVLPDGYLRLRDGSDVAALRFRNHLDENSVTITLTWNDYREEEDAGTDKDLDLYVEDWTGRRVGAGEKVQVSGGRDPGPDESRNPRERVVLTDLAAGPRLASDPEYTYRIRVRTKRGRFDANDRIRILLTASRDFYMAPGDGGPREAVEFLDASGEGELYPPADHPLVLTVGDSGADSSVGPTADRRLKPDILLEDSRTFFSDGEVSAGSSNAAAYLAGVVAVLKAAEPGLRTRHLLRFAQQGTAITGATARAGAGPGAVAGAGSVPPPPAPRLGPSQRPLTSTSAVAGRSPQIPFRAPVAAQPPASSASNGIPKPRATRLESAISLGLRLWQTPSRARLAATVRDGR